MKSKIYSDWYVIGNRKYRLNLMRVYMNIFIIIFASVGIVTIKDTAKIINDYSTTLTLDAIAGQEDRSHDKVQTNISNETTVEDSEPRTYAETNTTLSNKIETDRIANILNRDVETYSNNRVRYTAPIVESRNETGITDRELEYLSNFKRYNKREFKKSWFITLKKYCALYDIPVELMLSIYSGESGGNPSLRNPSSGALGLGQIMRGTYQDLRKIFKDSTSFSDMKNPHLNIKYTTFLVHLKLVEYKSVYTAFYSYGGCRKQKNKDRYRRYINKHVRNVIGRDVTVDKLLKTIKI